MDYTARADHEWFRIPRHGHLIACCDCGLVHLFKSRLRGRAIEIKAVRKSALTAARRRLIGVKLKHR